MDFQLQQYGSTSVVAVSGSIDALTADEFTSYLHEQVQAGNRQIVADLSQVDFMSSAGLRAIMEVLRTLRNQGGDLRLSAASANVEKVLKLTGITSILKIYPSAVEAVASFNSDERG